MPPRRPHLHPTYSTFSVGRRYLILHCLGLTCLPHLSKNPAHTFGLLSMYCAQSARDKTQEEGVGFGDNIGVSYPFPRSVTDQDLSIPVLRSMNVIGIHHTHQPPMLNVKGKGGRPIHGGRNTWMDKDRKIKRCAHKTWRLVSSVRVPDWLVLSQGRRS